MTKAQNIISDFICNIYLDSDSEELDNWLGWLAIMNGDEKLAEVINENSKDL